MALGAESKWSMIMNTTVITEDIKNIHSPDEKAAIHVEEKIYRPQESTVSETAPEEMIVPEAEANPDASEPMEGKAVPEIGAPPQAEIVAKRKAGPRKKVAPKAKVNRSPKKAVQKAAPMADAPDAMAKEVTGPNQEKAQEKPEAGETSSQEGIMIESPTPSTGDGWIDLNGKRYEYDVIVRPDGSVSKRDKSLSKTKKAKYGHTPLTGKEIKILLKESPELVIIGTGQTGAMPITPKARKMLQETPYLIGPTPVALAWLAKDKRRSVALLHITC